MIDRRLLLLAQFGVSVLVASGCIWVILAPTGATETNAAFALLGVIVTAWLRNTTLNNP